MMIIVGFQWTVLQDEYFFSGSFKWNQFLFRLSDSYNCYDSPLDQGMLIIADKSWTVHRTQTKIILEESRIFIFIFSSTRKPQI